MSQKRILFISGSVGLGHVGRDLEIAKALRRLNSEIEISWLAKDPASMFLEARGEKVLEEAKMLSNENTALEKNANNYKVNAIKTLMGMRKEWAAGVKTIEDLVEKEHYDLVVGDETYDLLTARLGNKDFKRFPFIIIYDIIGIDAASWSPFEKLVTYIVNRGWSRGLKSESPVADRAIFIGEVDDVPDRTFGFLLPNRREVARKYVDFVGNILTFNPKDYLDKKAVRKDLGYGEEPLIVCSIGGTSVGRDLLLLCVDAYPLIRAKIPDMKMVLVCGPRFPPSLIPAAEGLEVKGYVPDLFRYFAAADLCVVAGGGTTTLELIALQKPFLYFPLLNHFEQQRDVAWKCERLKAGLKMDFAKTTKETLANAIMANIDKKVNYPRIPINGASKAAEIISQVLSKNTS